MSTRCAFFKFEEILDDKWVSVGSAHVARLALQPGERLEEVVLTDLNVARSGRAQRAAEDDVLARGFEEVVRRS